MADNPQTEIEIADNSSPTLATSALQTTGNNRLGDLTETAPANDTASSGLNGRLQRIAQRLTSLIALFPTSLGQKTMANSFPIVVASDQSSIPVTVSSTSKATYAATISALSVAASATDIFTLTGSATKTVRVTRLLVSASQTSAANVLLQLLKRSSANTGGTSTTPTAVPYDSADSAATATVRAYTANPSSLGTLVGVVAAVKAFLSTGSGNNSNSTILEYHFGAPNNAKEIVLRGTSEVFSLNLNAFTVAGGVFAISVEWTEE